MSFDTQDVYTLYNGNATETVFPIPWAFSATDVIFVELWDKTDPEAPVKLPFVLNVDYTVVIDDNEATEEHIEYSVIANVAPTADQDVFIYRFTEAIRNVNYSTYRFPYPSVNNELDRLTQAVQELQKKMESVYVPDPYLVESGAEVGDVAGLFPRMDAVEEFIEDFEAAGGGLPPGAVAGDYLEHDGTDATWRSGVFEGFSARLGQAVSVPTVRDALLLWFDFQYLGPLISLSMAGSGTVREKGAVVSSSMMTATTTKRTSDIEKVEFFRSGSEIAEVNPANPNGGTEQYDETTDITDVTSFYARVTDVAGQGGPTTVQSNTVTFNFVYPYYHGCGVAGLSAAGVAGLTKSVITESNGLSRNFTAAVNDVYYFAYPAAYGVLDEILDVNSFDVTGDWTLRVENITGLDGNPVSYNIYEFNNLVGVAGSTTFTFNQ